MAASALPTDIDYIVVGGGLAGLVVASRLSEDPSKNVLIIEAGANRKGDPRIDTPGLMVTLYDDPNYDWMHMSVPQEHANNRQIAAPRGKVLGGSSAINFSALVYPSKANFNAWAELGNPGWSGEDMAPYFKKFHKYEPAPKDLKDRLLMDWVDEEIQGYDGPLPAAFTPELGLFNEAWMKTFKNLGFHLPGDPLAGEKLGVFQNLLSIHTDKGTRAYSASAYYSDEVANRPNLHLVSDALAEKILFKKADDGELIATGVQFSTTDGEMPGIVKAKKEVIISCGAFKSPQLLELSGIGGKDLLSKHGIEVLVDNPNVGENFQDHPLASISYEVADDQVSGDIMRDPAIVSAVMQAYQDTRGGPLSGTPLSFAYLPVVDGVGALSRPQVEQLLQAKLDGVSYPFFPSQAQQYAALRAQLLDPHEPSGEFMYIPLQLNGTERNGPTTMQQLFGKPAPGNYISIVAMINHPFSRGHVHIASADPAAPPRYDPRYLSHPLDIELLARQLQYAETIARTAPLASMLKTGGRRIPEGTDATGLEDAKEIARKRLFTAFHPSGTCAMISREMGGVVDGRLRVYGTRNVRVVDASVFPIEPLGNIQSTVYAVAEKAADLIKQDW